MGHKYNLITKQCQIFKPPQPLFGTSCFTFLPGSDNSKVLVLDSNSLRFDYFYIYNIIKNRIEFKTIAHLPSRLGAGKYQMTVSSKLQNHATLSQLEFIFVTNNIYNNKQRFIPMDIIKILCKYYYSVYCHIVGDGYYCQYCISPIFYCMDFADDDEQCRNYSYYAQLGFGKYVSHQNEQRMEIKKEFAHHQKIPNYKLLTMPNEILIVANGNIDCWNTESMKQRMIHLPQKYGFMMKILIFEPSVFMVVNRRYFVIFGGIWTDYDENMINGVKIGKNRSEVNPTPDIYYSEIEKIEWKLSSVKLPSNKLINICLMNKRLYAMDRE